jgi:hypothetical protein
VVIECIKEKPPAPVYDDGTRRSIPAERHLLPAKLLPDDTGIDPLDRKVEWRLGRRKERRIKLSF